MGIGEAEGENRAAEAARAAVSSPLLEASVEGATGILLNITGGSDVGLFEVNEAAEVVTGAADQNANVIFGAVIDENMAGKVRVTVIATGFGEAPARAARAGAKTRADGDREREPSQGFEVPADMLEVPPSCASRMARRKPAGRPACLRRRQRRGRTDSAAIGTRCASPRNDRRASATAMLTRPPASA